MRSEVEVRRALREWIARKSGKVAPDELADDTPILEQRILSSLQVMDLLLYVEDLSGRPIDVNRLRIGVFRNVDAIWQNFFTDGAG